jgi:hypothetical protein
LIFSATTENPVVPECLFEKDQQLVRYPCSSSFFLVYASEPYTFPLAGVVFNTFSTHYSNLCETVAALILFKESSTKTIRETLNGNILPFIVSEKDIPGLSPSKAVLDLKEYFQTHTSDEAPVTKRVQDLSIKLPVEHDIDGVEKPVSPGYGFYHDFSSPFNSPELQGRKRI